MPSLNQIINDLKLKTTISAEELLEILFWSNRILLMGEVAIGRPLAVALQKKNLLDQKAATALKAIEDSGIKTQLVLSSQDYEYPQNDICKYIERVLFPWLKGSQIIILPVVKKFVENAIRRGGRAVCRSE